MEKLFKKMLVYLLIITILLSGIPGFLTAASEEEAPFIKNQKAEFVGKSAGAAITYECDAISGGAVSVTLRFKTPEGWSGTMQSNLSQSSSGHFAGKAVIPSNAASIEEVIFKVETSNGKSASESIKYTNFKIIEAGLVVIFPQKIFDTVKDQLMTLLIEASDGSKTITYVDAEDLPNKQKTFTGIKSGPANITLSLYNSKDSTNKQYGVILATAVVDVTPGLTKVTLGEAPKLSDMKNIKVLIKTYEGKTYKECNEQLFIKDGDVQTALLGSGLGYFVEKNKVGNLVISVTPFESDAYNEYVFPELSSDYVLTDEGILTVTLSKRERSAVLMGIVKNENGQPITGALVSASQTVQGFNKISTAITDSDGNYTIKGLYAKTQTALTVAHKNYLENNENSVNTTTTSLIYDIVLVATLHHATIKLEYVPLKGGEKWTSTIEPSEVLLTVMRQDGRVIDGKTTAERDSLKFVPKIQTELVPQEKITYRIEHTDISKGNYTGTAILDSSGTTGTSATPQTLGRISFEDIETSGIGGLKIYIFNSKGNLIEQNMWAGPYVSPYLASGKYTAILISGSPIADGVMTLSEFNKLNISQKYYLKIENLNVQDGELTKTPALKVPDASNLQFVTYKSTMNAPESVPAGGLFEISGVIDSARKGTLDSLTIAQRGEDGDGLVTLSSAIIGGKTITNVKSLVSHGQTINIPNFVDKTLPVSYKFILRASDIDFHFFLRADVTIEGKKYANQVIGLKEIKITNAFTMDVPNRVPDGNVKIYGMGLPGETVTLYSNGTLLATAQVNSKGKYQVQITLPGTDRDLTTVHQLTAKSAGGSVSKNIWNCPREAVLSELTMINNQIDPRNGNKPYTTTSDITIGGYSLSYFALETTTLQFRTKFVNPSMLDSYTDGTKVRYVIKTNAGTTILEAQDKGNGIFESEAVNYGYYPPIAVNVLYASKPYTPAAPVKITNSKANAAQSAALNKQPDAMRISNDIASGIQKGVDLFAKAYDEMDGKTLEEKFKAYFAQEKVKNVIEETNVSAIRVFDYKKGIPYSDKFSYTQAVSQLSFSSFLSELGDGKEFRRVCDNTGKYNIYSRVRYYDNGGKLIQLNRSEETSAYTQVEKAAVAVETIYCVETSSTGTTGDVTMRETTIALPNTGKALSAIFGPNLQTPIFASAFHSDVPLKIFAFGESSSSGTDNTPVAGISFEIEASSMSANTAIGGVMTMAGANGTGASEAVEALIMNEAGGEVLAGTIQIMTDLNSALNDGSSAKQIATSCIKMESYLKAAYKKLPPNSSARAELMELLHEVQDTRLEAELADIQNDFARDVSVTGGAVSTVVGGTCALTGGGILVSGAVGVITGTTSFTVGLANDTRLSKLQNRFDKLLGEFEGDVKKINDAIQGGGGGSTVNIDGSVIPHGEIGDKTSGKLSPNFDPSGYIYEAVASNRVEGATVRLYYNGSFVGTGASKLSRINSENLLVFDDSDGLGQANPLISDKEGRYAWNVPEGLWLVKVDKPGYELATSSLDKAATVKGNNYNWLPVLPPQLDVNIGLISKVAPKIEKVSVNTNGILITFSKYMDTSMLIKNNFLVRLSSSKGKSVPFTLSLPDKEADPKNGKRSYARTVLLKCTLKKGVNINLTIPTKLKSYADVSMADVYSKTHTVKAVEQTANVVSSIAGGNVTNMAVVTLTSKTDGANIYYTMDGKTPTSTSKRYTEPLLINKTSMLKAIAISDGNTTSKVSSFTYTVSYNSDIGAYKSQMKKVSVTYIISKPGDKMVKGKATALSAITLIVNGKVKGTAKTDAKGNFSLKLGSALKLGDKLEVTSKLNNLSSAPLRITIK